MGTAPGPVLRRLVGWCAALAVLTTVIGAAWASPSGAQESGRVQLVNALMGQPIDVYVSGRILVADLAAGDTQDLTPLAGRLLRQVELRRSRTSSVLVGPLGSLTVPEQGYQTWVVHLDASGTPTLTQFVDDRGALAAGRSRLTVRHAAAAGAVDVAVSAGSPGQVVSSTTGLASGMQFQTDLDAGTVDRMVFVSGATTVLELQPLSLQPGEQLTVYVMGGAGGTALTPISFVTADLVVIPNRVDSGIGAVPVLGGRSIWPSPLVLVSMLGATLLAALAVRRVLDGRDRVEAANRRP